MSIVKRRIYLNASEPQQLSLRAVSGIDTKLDIFYMRASGGNISEDVLGQLQLTSRSDNRTTTYAALATDVVNGRARAVIPTSGMSDPNGYRLRLVGTVQGEPTLLAIGTVIPIEAAGLQPIPADVIDQIDLMLAYNEDAAIYVALWSDDTKQAPFDPTTGILAAAITTSGGITVPFSVTISGNKALLAMPAETVNTLPPTCRWNMTFATSSGMQTLAEGNVTITGTPLPPLTEVTANYDYQKPDQGDPAEGQIIHGNWQQSTLKIAKLDDDGIDRTDTLRLAQTGDQIVIGATTWTISEFFSEQTDWFIFDVLPVAQAATSGVVAVTFRRP